ncbi:lipoprotein [Pseudomonas guariconensis]|uniref:LPS translocon maturation chaperone LptM n=1 Tax=Pseudomonas TaxID=286 RepID=UPI001CE45522|nr:MULTISPECIES: lipoprotein [Pseudomonas]MCO7637168.1 lipoprotein [Pseudomonas sp. S 311-6]MCO7515336.1 lipoprotein [Pseudomonas putida]MCO7565739.1 lipoprotein [Pseudomonas mosselii]MCO7593413.1 lipoprotein [Pseudomonas guariconensis]MCO7605111.1 lipoprotein [Pseudomonas guariconensis]
MKRLISSLAALVAVACLVSACGQKGPLYLPEEGNGKEQKSHQHQHAQPSQPQEQQPELQPEQTPAQ